jgi:hypothetical protein
MTTTTSESSEKITVNGARVEALHSGGLRATIVVSTNHGDVWVVAGVPEADVETARRAGGSKRHGVVVAHGDGLDSWCPDRLQDRPDEVIESVTDRALAMWRECDPTELAAGIARAVLKSAAPERLATVIRAIEQGSWTIDAGTVTERAVGATAAHFARSYIPSAEDLEAEALAVLQQATSLDALLTGIQEHLDDIKQLDAIADLPTFGGETPDGAGIYSWDATRLLVGPGGVNEPYADFAIVPRPAAPVLTFEQVIAWCADHDGLPAEGWLTHVLNGELTLAQLRAVILAGGDIDVPVA